MSDAFIKLTDGEGSECYINTRNINYVEIWPEAIDAKWGVVFLRKAREGQMSSINIENPNDLPAIRRDLGQYIVYQERDNGGMEIKRL